MISCQRVRVFFADALSKWVVFKANFKDLAGEEGQNKGKHREKEGPDENVNSHSKPKTQEKII